MTWYVILMGILFFFIVCDYTAHIRGFNASIACLQISSFVMGILMCFRAVTVGADTKQYVYGFEQIKNIKWNKLFTAYIQALGGGELKFEAGYRIFNRVVGALFKSSQAITIASSILILILLYKLIKKWSANLMLSIWLYLTLGVFQTEMNMTRNGIAIMICYLAMRYVVDKKPIKYIAIIFVSMSFHSSSVLFLPFYWLINKVTLTKKRVGILFLTTILIGIIFSEFKPYLYYIVPYRYQMYLYGEASKFESLLLGLFHAGLVAFVVIVTEKKKREKILQEQPIGMWMFILESLFFLIGYHLSSATRIAALFGPYLLIYIPYLIDAGIQSKKKKNLVTWLVIFLCGIQYILRLSINNIGGTMPYSFFWN